MSGEQRALVVDDDRAIRNLVGRILARHGFAVDEVADGAAAIEHLGRNDYAVIVLDLMMPRVDGHGVIRYLSDHAPNMFERLIVTTADSTPASKLCPPVVRFVRKPFEITKLVSEVDEASAARTRVATDAS